ncbi:MAG: hypothetical protein JWL60_1190 [Gemmatimonadetes bacterium]|nr:hypothetical protein [Gemmatimonadota bacterium]
MYPFSTRLVRPTLAAIAVMALPLGLGAQADSARSPATAPATPRAAPATTGVGGLIFGSYNFSPSTTPNQQPNQVDNSFILDRVYLTFRAALSPRLAVRVTTDVYQSTEATPNAYAIRAKYAYLQYDAAKRASGAQLMGRVGILQNVVIEHVETFWPRYLSQTAAERAGYFQSADVGVAGQATLPNRMGEVYTTITNGAGYASRERDRFKDFAARLSLTPLATRASSGLVQSLTLTAWGYKGATASAFVNGGAGQVGAVGDALERIRYGVLVGVRDPRLTLAGELGWSRDGRESGANTLVSPRERGLVSGRLASAIGIVRPFAFTSATGTSPFALLARVDVVRPTARSENLPAPLPEANAYHTLVAGVTYDVNPRVSVAADYQESLASRNGLSGAPPGQSKGLFAHLSVGF